MRQEAPPQQYSEHMPDHEERQEIEREARAADRVSGTKSQEPRPYYTSTLQPQPSDLVMQTESPVRTHDEHHPYPTRERQHQQEEKSIISQDVDRENVEYERYQNRLRHATNKQDKIFEQFYKQYFLPAKQKEA